MPITEICNYFKNRQEQMRQKIAVKGTCLDRLIQPYVDKIGYLPEDLTIIRGEDPIGVTKFRSIFLRKIEGNRLLCWFLQSDGSGFRTGDLQLTMACSSLQGGTHPLLSFETIEVFKLPRKEERYWLPLKPADQLKNLKLANECLGILETLRSGTE